MGLALAVLLPLTTGYLVVCSILPRPRSILSHFLLKLSLAVGVGSGIFSCGFFIWLVACDPASDTLAIVDVTLLSCSILLLGCAIKIRRDGGNIEPDSTSRSAATRIAGVLLLLLCAGSVLVFLSRSYREPHGSVDAFAIWNLRARFIFRSGDAWRDAFSILDWSHLDYPLLIPGIVARSWRYVGEETTIVPIAMALGFTFSTVGLLYAALSAMRSRSQGLLGALLLLSTPVFLQHGASQTADVPIGLFYLSTLVLLCLSERLPRGGAVLFLAGVTAGLSAWTKNEGLLFTVSLLVASGFAIVRARGWRSYSKQILPFVAGLLPILAIVLYFKTQLASPNDVVATRQLPFFVERLTDGTRYLQIGEALVRQVIGFNYGTPILLAVYALLAGIKKTQSVGGVSATILFCLMLGGYFGIYLITPYDLDWHLRTSLIRLLLQIWPSALFVFFLVANTPEEIVAPGIAGGKQRAGTMP